MTTREKIHQLVDELPEADLDPVAEILASRGGNGDVDEGGDLDAWSDGASKDTMRMLDEEEAAIGFSREQRNPA
ncbi:MAG TPA: hypothetical protein VIJ66_13630 [Solirubrobacteraceae bacterium]